MKPKKFDIMFIHDTNKWNLVSTAIMITTTNTLLGHKNKVPYHTAVYLGYGKVIEAVWGGGVREVNLWDYYSKKSLTVWFKRLKDWGEDEIVNKEMLENWLHQRKGRPYDKWQILSIFGRSFLRIIPPLYRFIKRKTSFLDSRKKFICSELVLRAFEIIGTNLYPSASSATITPNDLNKSKLLEEV